METQVKEDRKVCIEQEKPDKIMNRSGVESVESGWSWVVLAGSFMTQFMIGGSMRSGGLIYLKLEEKFNASAVKTVWVISLAVTFRMLFGPLASVLSNRFSYRVVVCTGGVLICSGLFLSGFPNDLWPLYFTFSLTGGIGRAFIYTPAVVIVGQYFDKRRGMAVGLGHAGLGTGCLVIPTLIEPIFDYYNFTGAFIILGGITLQTVVFGSLFRPLALHMRILRHDRRMKELKHQEQLMELSKKDQSHGELNSELLHSKNGDVLNNQAGHCDEANCELLLRQKCGQDTPDEKKLSNMPPRRKLLDVSLLRNIRFVLYCSSFLLFSFSFQASLLLLPPYVTAKGLTEREAAYLISIPGATEIIGSVVGGLLLDRKRIKPHSLSIYNVILYLYACLTILMVLFNTFIPLFCVCAFYGLLLGVSSGHRATMLSMLVGTDRLISAFGILSLFQGLGVLIGPPIAGLLKDIYGRYDESFYCGFVVLILAGLTQNSGVFIRCFRPKHNKSAEI